MYACMTPVGFDSSDKFENHWPNVIGKARQQDSARHEVNETQL